MDDSNRLYIKSGDGFIEATPHQVANLASDLVKPLFARGETLDSDGKAQKYLVARLTKLDHEVFGAVALDDRGKVIKDEILSQGTIDMVMAAPREIVKWALDVNAFHVFVYHNHPSSTLAEPSQQDIAVAQKLRDALLLFDIVLLDAYVIGGGKATSMRLRGDLDHGNNDGGRGGPSEEEKEFLTMLLGGVRAKGPSDMNNERNFGLDDWGMETPTDPDDDGEGNDDEAPEIDDDDDSGALGAI